MNVYVVLIGIAAVAYLVNKIYRNPGKVVFTESDNVLKAQLIDVNEEVLAGMKLGANDQLSLQETATSGKVLVKAQDSEGKYVNIGYLEDVELYKKVQQKRARGKVASVDQNKITVEYSFS